MSAPLHGLRSRTRSTRCNTPSSLRDEDADPDTHARTHARTAPSANPPRTPLRICAPRVSFYAFPVPALPPTLDWLFSAIAGAMAIGALFLLVRALFRDRARGRYRCPRCWYDLTPKDGAPALPITCSECGRVAKKIRRLRKTRRRWRWALVALALMAASGAVALYPRVQRNGFWSLVPTWFLVDTMPVFGYPTVWTRELSARCGDSSASISRTRILSASDLLCVLKRAVNGSILAEPGSKRWWATYGAFARAEGRYLLIERSPAFIAPDQLREADDLIEELRNVPAHCTLRARKVWPVDTDLYVQQEIEYWQDVGVSMSVDVRDKHSHRRWDSAGVGYLIVPARNLESTGTLGFRVSIDLYHPLIRSGSREKHIERLVEVPYTIRGNAEDLMSPVVDPALNALVASIQYFENPAIWNLDVGTTYTPATNGIAFGVLMEHVCDGETRAVERVWWSGGPPTSVQAGNRVRREWVSYSRFGATGGRGLEIHRWPGEHWTVRIRSDPETALRVLDADKYWEGDVTIPLTIR